jgi:integrase
MRDIPTSHTLLDGKLHLFRRPKSRKWQSSTYLAGREHRASTKTESLVEAKEIARDWYLTLHGKLVRGELKLEKTFKDAAAVFAREYEIITEGQRHPRYVSSQNARLTNHLTPFFGCIPLSAISPGTIQEYRIGRAGGWTNPNTGKLTKPSRSTLHQEIVVLRQVLKTAVRLGWLTHVPDLAAPYKASGKISHRGWFSPEEYRQLYRATRRRALKFQGTPRGLAAARVHDYVLFMANTGLRPDEAARIQYRDVAIVADYDSNETILEIQVRGKRGVGYCKSTVGAVRPFERLQKRSSGEPTELIFPPTRHKILNKILVEENLKVDREGSARTAYSLRHTYICFRLLEGADIYQIAKNCRTSVEMIEKYYAAHIKTNLNAAAINVRRTARPDRRPPPAPTEKDT